MRRKILLMALGIFLVGSGITCAADSEPIVINTTSTALIDIYVDNEIKADYIYKNRNVIVRGEVGLVGRYRGDIAYLIFRHIFVGEGMFDKQMGGVLCEFSKKNETQLINVREGDRVRVKGKCRGLEGLHVILEDCVIVD